MDSDLVLIVDDEPNVHSAISRQLRGRFSLFTAENADKALSLLDFPWSYFRRGF